AQNTNPLTPGLRPAFAARSVRGRRRPREVRIGARELRACARAARRVRAAARLEVRELPLAVAAHGAQLVEALGAAAARAREAWSRGGRRTRARRARRRS